MIQILNKIDIFLKLTIEQKTQNNTYCMNLSTINQSIYPSKVQKQTKVI